MLCVYYRRRRHHHYRHRRHAFLLPMMMDLVVLVGYVMVISVHFQLSTCKKEDYYFFNKFEENKK